MSSVLGSLRKAREWAMPTLKQSAFLEKGVLTPEEFVKAGDELVYKCPTWCWESGDPSKAKSYLPPDKQYLITRNIPCQNRVSAMETTMEMKAMSGGDGDGDDEDDWLVSSIIKATDKLDLEDDFDILDEEGEVIPKEEPQETEGKANEGNSAAKEEGENGDDDDEYADMAGFEEDNILQDDSALVADDSAAAPSSGNGNGDDDDDNIIKVRTYDLSITYDKYYQTPRVWMIGRSAENQPLTGEEMMQDVISDYANKTVTMESHPHVSAPHASIHPCQHGKVMKAIVKNLIKKTTVPTDGGDGGDGGGGEEEATTTTTTTGPSVEMYLFIFLKFVSSMIPTINYDFTMEVTADTSK